VLADTAGCTRALARAESELDHARPENTPQWITWMSEADLHIDAGRALLDLHQPRRAATALNTGLRRLDPTRARSRAVFQTYQAESALHDHDLPAALTHARHALETALDTGAARCTALVNRFLPRLQPHDHDLDVRDFLHHARTRLANA
jgi:hypothetical protein